MTHLHWVVRGTGIPKDRDEVNRREVYECDGRVCDVDKIIIDIIDKKDTPSKLNVVNCCFI
jgi:hypothetical protein